MRRQPYPGAVDGNRSQLLREEYYGKSMSNMKSSKSLHDVVHSNDYSGVYATYGLLYMFRAITAIYRVEA